MNLQYSLFAKLIGKYLVGRVGRSKKMHMSWNFFLEKQFYEKRFTFQS